MLLKHSGNMGFSRASISLSKGFSDVTLGEGMDMTPSHKTGFYTPTTGKTTTKTTEHTTLETKKLAIFASVKNLIRLFIRFCNHKKCVQFLSGI